MRHIVLTVTLVPWTSQVDAAILFTPDSFTLTINPVFDETGTAAFCWQCGDADPVNDLRVFLGPFPKVGGDWNQFQAYSGSSTLRSTAPNYSGLEANFSLYAKLSTWGASLPESLANPSVSFGMIPGRFRGVNGGSEIVLECCDGFVGPLYIQQAFYPPSPFVIPPGGRSKLVALELHPFGDQVPYTPATPIPEPASLLLFGSACAAAALKRRRGKTEGSQRGSVTRI